MDTAAMPRLHAEGRRFDLVFVDAGGGYDEVSFDVSWALKLLKPGGSIAVHDYGHVGYTDKKKVCDEFFPDGPTKLVYSLFVKTPPMKLLVVASYTEDLEWIPKVPDGWVKVIYSKGDKGFVALPNVGREAHTYLHDIVTHYAFYKSGAEAVFCQGNPFDHDPDFIAHLSDASIRAYGMVMDCAPDGGPHMADAFLHEYCRVFDLPIQTRYRFVAGAQFRVRGEQITAHPLAFYEALLALTKIKPRAPYSLERLWGTIFGLDL